MGGREGELEGRQATESFSRAERMGLGAQRRLGLHMLGVVPSDQEQENSKVRRGTQGK